MSDVRRVFRSLRLPPVPTLSPVVADACAAMAGSSEIAWEELGIRVAARHACRPDAGPGSEGDHTPT